MAEQFQALEALKGNSGLKKEIEFEKKLPALLDHYGFSLTHIVNLLEPESTKHSQKPVATTGTRKPREVKIYKNPHTGEVIETKGGNHKVLKEWKTKHGGDEVESWLSQ